MTTTLITLDHDKADVRNSFRYEFMELLYRACKNAPHLGADEAWRELAERFGLERMRLLHFDGERIVPSEMGKPTD